MAVFLPGDEVAKTIGEGGRPDVPISVWDPITQQWVDLYGNPVRRGGAAPPGGGLPPLKKHGPPTPPGGTVPPPPPKPPVPWWRDPKSLAGLIPLLMAGRGGGGNTFGSPEADAEFLRNAYGDAKHTQALKEARFRRVDPLHEAVTQLAFSRMPTNSVQGINLPRVPLPEGRKP